MSDERRLTMPHELCWLEWRLCLTAAAVSALLSLWALFADPVINNDGVVYVKAAQHFSDGDWASGFALYKWPFYSIVIGVAQDITGLGTGRAAYLVNAGLYAFLVLGFVALVHAVGGGRAALWSAAAVVLAQPALNEFRSFVIRDTGYWACYLWSLAYFFSYLRCRRRNLLGAWAVLAAMAFLFRVEGVALLTVLPACLYAADARGRRRTISMVALAAIAAVLAAVSPLWQYVSESGVSGDALLSDPGRHIIESWRTGSAEILSRLAALQREFPGISGYVVPSLVYLCSVAGIAGLELIKTLGIVFSGLAVYGAWHIRALLPDRLRRWWLLITAIQGLLVCLFVFSNFFLAERYPVGLALTILVLVPLVIERTWQAWHRQGRTYSWQGLLVAALLVIESVEGLNVATQKEYIRDAGLWLRQHAAPGSTIYSNNRIVVYYSGLTAPRNGGDHSWQEAMSEVWTDRWRDYDYFVLVMNEQHARNEVLLLRRMEARPVRTFTNGKGEQVLVFRAG